MAFIGPYQVYTIDGVATVARVQDWNKHAVSVNTAVATARSGAVDDAKAYMDAEGYAAAWKANTAYTVGERVIAPNGDVVTAKTGFTTGLTYVAANWNASGQDGRIKALETRTATTLIPAGANLNDYLTPGLYGQNVTANATTALNYPRGVRGLLEVLSVAGTSTVIQRYTTGGATKSFYTREYYAGVWSASWADIGAGGGASAGTAETKLVGTALSLSGGPENNIITTDYSGRLLLDYGVTIPRWRVHMRNHNIRDNVAYPGSLNLLGFSIGEAETIDGLPSGRWDGTVTQLQGAATTPTAGTEWVSAWFSHPLESSKKYMLSYGFTAAAGQEVHRGFSAVWTVSAGSSATHTNSYGSRSTLAPLDIWIECEVPATTKVLGVVGDSLSCGHSSTSPVHDSWLAAYCRTHKALPVFWAASGDRLEWFTDSTAPKATRYSSMSRPDTLYFAMGSNDISTGATLAQMQTRYLATVALLRKIATENIVVTAIRPPEPGETEAAVRIAYTEWLEAELPGRASLFKDIGAPIKAADGTLDPRWRASPTNIHLSTPGYARMASAL